MSAFSFENVCFSKFAFYSGVVVGKTMLMSSLVFKERTSRNIFVNEEDCQAFTGGKVKPTTSDPKIERIRRSHQNDIENIVPFVVVGLFYVATNPDPWWAAFHFRLFAASRVLHTLSYLVPLPQPSRSLTCVAGWLTTVSMAVSVFRHAEF